jgi:hypothetical protein
MPLENGDIGVWDVSTGEFIGAFGSVSTSAKLAYVSSVPIPASAWLFCSAMLGLFSTKSLNVNHR